ncbi:zinc finger protein 414 [Gadus morhua]|nr:zinc finger protein 414-like [Gadus morhua]
MMSTQTLTRHPEGNRRLHCPLYGCKRVFTDTVALESHIKDHEIPAESIPGKILLCSSIGCSDSFPDMQQLMQHMRHHHKPNIFFLCESCRAKLRSHRGLLLHLHTCSKVSRAKLKTEQTQGPPAPEGPTGYPAATGEDWSQEQGTPQGESATGHTQAPSHSQQASAPPSHQSPLKDSQETPSYQQLQNFSRPSLTCNDGDMLTADPLQFDGQTENQGQFQAQAQGQLQSQYQGQFQAQGQGQFQAQGQGQFQAQAQGQGQFQSQHQGQFQAPPEHQPQYQAHPQHQFQAPSQHQVQFQGQPQHQGQVEAQHQVQAPPQPPTSSAAVWKKNQGSPGNSRILWEHTRGRYRCVQCSLVLPNRKAMTAHIHTEHKTPAET